MQTTKSRVSTALALFVTLALALVGCGAQPAPMDTAPQDETSAEAAPSDADAAADSPAGDVDAHEKNGRALGPLHVEGTQLVDEAGESVQLKGISTHGLSWYPQYVNAELFSELSNEWGANAVRLALYTAEGGGYCTDGDKAALDQLARDGVDYATEAGLYVIVDWHILSDNNPLDHVEEADAFFKQTSAALADHTNVLYEICNEPNGATTWADVKAYAERIIPVIRANDPDSVIIVGTPEWSQRVDSAASDPLEYPNVLYTLHFYAATHKNDLRNRMTEAVSGGLPVFVSEFGICDASGNGSIDEASANEWVRAMDEAGVSYLMWNLSNKDESSSAISAACDKTSGFAASDLSTAGKWLLGVLQGELTGEPDSNVGAAVGMGSTRRVMAYW